MPIRTWLKTMVWIALCSIFLLGCGAKNTIVLMPDPDGQVGALSVKTDAGEQVVDQPGHMVTVTNAQKPPSPPKAIDPQDIDRMFGAALAVQPNAPVRFILYFQQGSTELTPASEAQLDQIVAVIKERQSDDVSVVGHTDRVGSKSANLKLSLARARRVKERLTAAGLDAAILEVTSHGEANPLVSTADEVAEPKNRRVEVTVR
jgi:outer membrane protein OmpA-like peptidoglycan-associated protein